MKFRTSYFDGLLLQTIWTVSVFLCALCGLSGPGAKAQRNLEADTVFIEVPRGTSSGGVVFLRFFNYASADPKAQQLLVDLADPVTGLDLGTWISPVIPAHASLQVSLATIEWEAVPNPGQTIVGSNRPSINLAIISKFTGYAQEVVWSPSMGMLANTSHCLFPSIDGQDLINVHSGALVDYVSHIQITNDNFGAPVQPTLTFFDAVSGAQLATWQAPMMSPGSSLDVTVPQIEATVPALAHSGLAHYNVEVPNDKVYLTHIVENKVPRILTDLSTKCGVWVFSGGPISSRIDGSGMGSPF